MDDILKEILKKLEGVQSSAQLDSDVRVLQAQMLDNGAEIVKLKAIEGRVETLNFDKKNLWRGIEGLESRTKSLEDRLTDVERTFDKMTSSIESVKNGLDLRLELLGKSLDKMTEITERSAAENLEQSKDIENVTQRLRKIESKVDSVTRLEEKALENERKLTVYGKTFSLVILAIITSMIAAFFKMFGA